MGCVNVNYYLPNCLTTDKSPSSTTNSKGIFNKAPIRQSQTKKKQKDSSTNFLDAFTPSPSPSPFLNYFNNTPILTTQVNHSCEKTTQIESEDSERNKKIQQIKTIAIDKQSIPNTVELSSIKQIIYPQLTLQFISNINASIIETAILTPNSLTKQEDQSLIIKDITHKFSFGSALDNDFVLNDSNLSEKQFYTFYNSKKNEFHIVDSITGTGLFVQINDNLVIKHDTIVSFCTDHIYLQVNETENNTKEIKIKFLQSNKEDEYSFNSIDKKVITIGRGLKCDIVHEGESVSKVQCTLKYEDNNWVLYDGLNMDNEKKKSTNGLWLLANVSIALKDGMILKTGIYTIMVKIKEG